MYLEFSSEGKGAGKDSGGRFAKACFETSVGVWSARRGKKYRFLIACFGFFRTDLIAHNPEGSEGSAAGGRGSDLSEWPRSIFSRRLRPPPKI